VFAGELMELPPGPALGELLASVDWESAGINRYGEGDERALHRRVSAPRWPPSHASTTREGVAKR
jgi:hypothetical protein